ncbi:MAG: DUF1489 domain-containing protein [Paracoccaceae bacterium]
MFAIQWTAEMTLNLIKLCVGCDSVEDLIDWQTSQRSRWPAGTTEHVTRMWPRREAEVLDGGALYWVIKGQILCRQPLLRLEERLGGDGISRCALVLSSQVIRTAATPRRPFQGWRYLPAAESPPDLPQGREREEALPPDLARALADMGLR